MHRIGHSLEVAVGQHHAGGGFYVRGKHQGGFFGGNGRLHLGNGGGRPRGLSVIDQAAGFEYGVTGRNLTHVENLCPAVAEPAVADHHHMFAGGELACHRLHAECAAARHQGHRMRLVHLLEHARNVGHDARKTLGHVVECAVGVDD